MRRLSLHLSLAAVLSLLLWSCAQDALLQNPEEPQKAAAPANPYRVSLKEALATADLFLDELDGGKTRKARQPRSIEYYVPEALTRSGSDVDTLLYIVNYADDEGFAILGADRRVNPVYGFSNEGNLDLSDTVNNRGLALCMQNIRYSTAMSINNPWVLDSIKFKPQYPGAELYPGDWTSDRTIKYIKNVKPKIAKNPSRWIQSRHFNDFCPIVDGSTYGSRGDVGCVPLATAQIMSYYAWPQSYQGIALDWDDINNTPINISEEGVPFPVKVYSCPTALSQFLAKIGSTYNAEYSIAATSVTKESVRDNFYKFGYEALPNPVTFTFAKAIEDIVNSPLLVFGLTNSSNVGHCWVIDGFVMYEEKWSAIANETHTLLHSYFHCVWGWGGSNNGYFDWDSGFGTNPSETREIPRDNDDELVSYRKYVNLWYFNDFKPKM